MAARERRERGLRAQPPSVRPGVDQLGGGEHADSALGEQGGADALYEQLEL
jgi:hypothetical protein